MQDILEQATQWFGKVAEFEQTQNKCCQRYMTRNRE